MSQENGEEIDYPPGRCYKCRMRGVRFGAVAVALVTLAGIGGGAVAAAQPALPPTLSGESFHQDTPTITSIDCDQTTNFTYSATGRAAGPYPGTFTETGTLTRNQLSANFTINSPVGRVTGTKASSAGVSCSNIPCSGVADCQRAIEEGAGASFNTNPIGGFGVGDIYQARITTANGIFADNGLFNAVFYRVLSSPLNGFDEHYRSELDAPVPLAPTAKKQCKKGGWRQFGFRNQGQCIRFVKHGPKKQAAGLRE